MNLPCITCKNKIVRLAGHRELYGCKDVKLKEDNFIEDDYFYEHKCRAYEQEAANE